MLPLNCSLKICDAKVKALDTEITNGGKRTVFEPEVQNLNCIVQHNYNTFKGEDFHDNFELPRIQEYKPFDGDSSDWNWVEEDGE